MWRQTMNDTANELVLLEFWATWCNPCKAMAPVVERVVDEVGGVRLVNINVDDETELSTQYNIRAIPSFVLLKDGKIIDRLVGAASAERFKNFLSSGK
jgi:thioredoxin 1